MKSIYFVKKQLHKVHKISFSYKGIVHRSDCFKWVLYSYGRCGGTVYSMEFLHVAIVLVNAYVLLQVQEFSKWDVIFLHIGSYVYEHFHNIKVKVEWNLSLWVWLRGITFNFRLLTKRVKLLQRASIINRIVIRIVNWCVGFEHVKGHFFLHFFFYSQTVLLSWITETCVYHTIMYGLRGICQN